MYTLAACRVHLHIKQLINPAPAFLTSYSISSGQSLINSIYTFVDPNATLALAAAVNHAAKLIINGDYEQHYVWLTKSCRNVIRSDFSLHSPSREQESNIKSARRNLHSTTARDLLTLFRFVLFTWPEKPQTVPLLCQHILTLPHLFHVFN